MSFTEILDASGAARGAIYHHFPGGKAELVAEAATRNGQDVRSHLAALAGATPAAILDNFLAAVRPVVAASAAGGGCAVAAVAVEPDGDALRHIADTAFTSWTTALAERFGTTGVEPRGRGRGPRHRTHRPARRRPHSLPGRGHPGTLRANRASGDRTDPVPLPEPRAEPVGGIQGAHWHPGGRHFGVIGTTSSGQRHWDNSDVRGKHTRRRSTGGTMSQE